MHVKNERDSQDGTWEDKYEWNTVILYAAHDYDSNVMTFGPSKNV